MKTLAATLTSGLLALAFLVTSSAALGFASRLEVESEKKTIEMGLLSVDSVDNPASQ